MKTEVRGWVLAVAVAVAGALWLVGCGGKQSESAAPPAASQQPTTQPAAPAGEAAESEESGEKIAPAGTVKEIWGQIAQEQDKLAATIQNGQLKDVHHLAFGIRDLVVALADKAGAEMQATAPKLKPLVDQVRASAGKLDELGDAGDVSGTQAEFSHLSEILNVLKGTTVAK